MTTLLTVIIGLLFLVANLLVLWINVKLYTEVLKHQSFEVHAKKYGAGADAGIVRDDPEATQQIRRVDKR